MNSDELLEQLRKALSDIDRSRLTHSHKSVMLANGLEDYLAAWRRHDTQGFISRCLRWRASEVERGLHS
jgi:hypothetical protein